LDAGLGELRRGRVAHLRDLEACKVRGRLTGAAAEQQGLAACVYAAHVLPALSMAGNAKKML
jgi:hypothetical protein